MSKNMIIGQSGGPTAVINSSLAGAIEYAFSSNKIDTVYGMINGIQGLLENNIIDLKERFYCLLYTSPSPRDPKTSRMPSSA